MLQEDANNTVCTFGTARGVGSSIFFIPDGDEIPEPELLANLSSIAIADLADIVHVQMQTYWKTTSAVVSLPEELAPIIMVNAQVCQHEHIREYAGGTQFVFSRDHGYSTICRMLDQMKGY